MRWDKFCSFRLQWVCVIVGINRVTSRNYGKPMCIGLRSTLWTGTFLLACIVSDLGRLHAVESDLRSRGDGKVVEISEDGVPVLVYQIQENSLDGAWPRAGYVHPLYDLDGKVFTEDFPEDHRHHRGVFWAWHHLSVGDLILGDPWLCKDFVRECTQTTTGAVQRDGQECVGIELVTLWKSPLLKNLNGEMLPVVKEETHIVVHRKTEHVRSVDFDISLLAMLQNVRLGGSDDAKGYGGFSPRIKLNSKQVFRFGSGEVEPTRTALQGGAWVDISDAQRGLTIMSHPGNPVVNRGAGKTDSGNEKHKLGDSVERSSPLWILRRKNSMQNVAYPGRKPVSLSAKTPMRLRYRLVIHDGTVDPARLQGIYKRYAGEK